MDEQKLLNKSEIAESEKININFHGVSFFLEKNVLLNIDYFRSKLTRWYKPGETIYFDDPTLSINGFLYILDIAFGKCVDYKPEYKPELTYFGIDFEREEVEEEQENKYTLLKKKPENTFNYVSRNGYFDILMKENIRIPEIFNKKNELMNYFNNPREVFSEGITSLYFDQIGNGIIKTYIMRKDDVFNCIDLEISLKGLQENFVWKRNIGFKIIRCAKLLVNDEVIVSLPGEFLEAEYHLYTPENKRSPELVFDLDIEEREILSKDNLTLLVPLQFIRPDYNDKYEIYKRAFPLICSQFSEFSVQIEFNEFNLLEETKNENEPTINFNHKNFRLFVQYQSLGTDFRRDLASQENYIFYNTLYSKFFTFNGKSLYVNTNIYSYMKDFIITVKSKDNFVDDLIGIQVQANGHDLINATSELIKYKYPKRYLSTRLPKGYYYYSFCLDPYNSFKTNCILPTNQIDIFTFRFEMKYSQDYEITLLASGINVLSFVNGHVRKFMDF